MTTAPKITASGFPKLDLPITPPYPPIEAKQASKIPAGEGWLRSCQWGKGGSASRPRRRNRGPVTLSRRNRGPVTLSRRNRSPVTLSRRNREGGGWAGAVKRGEESLTRTIGQLETLRRAPVTCPG